MGATKPVRIILEMDYSCEMARVHVDERHKTGLQGMTGNLWDFHPGCHGITEFGDFHGPGSLAKAIQKKLTELGRKSVIESREFNWTTGRAV